MTSAKPITDNDKKLVRTGKDNEPKAFYNSDFQYSSLGRLIIYRLLHDRDMKIVITSKGKTTGTGKTTLAIHLARWINKVRNDIFSLNEQWSAKKYSFMNVWEYLNFYKNAKPGVPLITDELEKMADRRRSMGNKNVFFSQAWSMLRYKNVVTIGTAPGLMDLDKRIPEACDIWINVVMKGRANVYYMSVDDFEWTREVKRLKKFGFRESILWEDLGDTEDYKYLKQTKRDLGIPGVDNRETVSEQDIKEKEKQLKTKFAKELLSMFYENNLMRVFTQEDIAETVGYSQQKVSQIKRKMQDNGELPEDKI